MAADTLSSLRYIVAELEYHRDHPSCKFEPEVLIVASGARAAIAADDTGDTENTMRRTLDLLKIVALLPVTALALIAFACNIDPDEAAGWRQ